MDLVNDACIYQFTSSDEIFIDTNVWLYLFNPYTKSDYGYSAIIQKIIDSGAKIYITEQVLSEFSNRIVRLSFNRYKDERQNKKISYKKKFRNTLEYLNAYHYAMNSIVEDILPLSNILQVSQEDLLECCSACKMLDFNDNIYLSLAKKNNLSILTHDNDFVRPSNEVTIFRSTIDSF